MARIDSSSQNSIAGHYHVTAQVLDPETGSPATVTTPTLAAVIAAGSAVDASEGDVLTVDTNGDAGWASPATPDVPSLAEVFAVAGGETNQPADANTPVQLFTPAGPNGDINAGADFQIWAGSAASGLGGGTGGTVSLASGDGLDAQDTSFYGASVLLSGGSANKYGRIRIDTENAYATKGDVLGYVSGDLGTLVWSQLVTTASSTPVGGNFVSILVADTTNKVLYAWTGSDYIQIGAWT